MNEFATDAPQDDQAEGRGTVGAAQVGRGWTALRISAVVVAVVFAGLIVVLATRDQHSGIRVASPLIGELVPPVSGELIWPPATDDGATPNPSDDAEGDAERAFRIGTSGNRAPERTFNIDNYSRRWVLVNFFASWCAPCEREHPELIRWAARHPYDGLVVGVPFGDRTQDAVAFYERLGGDWPVIEDAGSRWAVEFGVLQPPESFLVAPGGTVVARWQGQITADVLDEVIATLSTGAPQVDG